MNTLNPIKELYNMYLEEEKTPWIMEIVDNRLGCQATSHKQQ